MAKDPTERTGLSMDALSKLACAATVAAGLIICRPDAALAAGGGGGGGAGGNACPWQQDITLEVGSATLTIPQSAFDPKSLQTEIEGHTLFPDINRLSLRIMTPAGDTWEAPLTYLGGKRCVAFYVGKAVLVAEAYVPPTRPRRNRVAEH